MGVEILRRYQEYWGDRVDVQYIPFFLGGIMQGSKNRPPAAVPGITNNSLFQPRYIDLLAKGLYMQKDLARSGKLLGMPRFKQPSVFPIQSYKVPRPLECSEG
jgi:2-hydroxychromene-2-carboxylate isomerase